MSAKKKTTTDQTSTQTSTPNVPSWFAQPTQTMAGNVSGLINGGPGQFTPTISNLQQQATSAAGGLTTSPYYTQAADTLGGVQNVTPGTVGADQVQGQSVLDNLGAYETPYRQQVLDPTLADFDANAAQQKAAMAAHGATGGGSAFGGSRFGVAEGQLGSDLDRARASTEGGLLQNLYTQATGLSEADTARRQQAASGNQAANLQAALANQSTGLQAQTTNANLGLQKAGALEGLGTASDADTRANLQLQAGMGGVQTDTENAIRQYPLTYAAQTEGLLSGLNPQLFTGNTTTGVQHGTTSESSDPGLLGALGTAAQIGSLFVPGVGGVSAAGNFAKLFGGGGLGEAPH